MKINHEIRDKAALDNAIALREIADRMLSEANRSNRTLDSIFYAHLLTSWAGFLDDFRKENTELRAQLVAFQKAANPAVAFDLAGGSDSTAWYTPFVRGAHVCLKSHPDQHGTVVDSFIHSRAGLRCHVCFDDECNRSRWVNAKNLELVPDK